MSEDTKKNTLVTTLSLFEGINPTTVEHHRIQGRRPKNSDPKSEPPTVDIMKVVLPSDNTFMHRLEALIGSGDPEVGRGLITRRLQEMVMEASEDASDDSFEGDDFIGPKFEAAWLDYWQPSSRRKTTGLKKKDIQARLVELAAVLTEIVSSAVANGGVLDEEGQNKFAQVQLEQARLEESLAKKNRRGEKPAVVKA